MESKKSFGKKLEHFIEGRGFYIVLVLCAAVIGVSGWSLLSGTGAMDTEPRENPTAVLSTVTPEPEPPEPELPEPKPAPAPETAPTAAKLYVWPVSGEIIRPYSMTALQKDPTMGDWRTHDGIDVAAEFGTPVMAVTDGTVKAVYHDDLYGTTVVIDHGDGLECMYSNLEEVPTVYVGDTVTAGGTIGSVGASAGCESEEASHLHLAASKDGASISPLEVLPEKNAEGS